MSDARSGPRRVVAAVFVVLAVVTGLGFYSMSAYLDFLTAKGFAVSVVSLGPTLSTVAAGVGGVWAARLLPRVPSRALLLGGAVVAGLGLAGVGRASTTAGLYLAFAVFGFATAFTSTVPCANLIARWFAPHPERAMSLATSGMSVGGAVAPPIVLAVLTRFGLPGGSALIGLGLLVVVALAALVVVEPPRPPAAPAAPLPRPARIPPRPFPALFTAFALLTFAQVATATHILRIARERDVGGLAAILSVIAVCSLLGRLVGAALVTRLGLRYFAALIAFTQVAAQLLLSVADSQPLLITGAGLLGTTMGNTFVLMSLFVLAAFDLPEFPRTYAWLTIGGTVGGACGPAVLGLAHDWLTTYDLPLLGMAAASAAGAVLLHATRIRTAGPPP